MYGKTTGMNPKYIGENRFNNAAKYILDDLKSRENINQASSKPNESGVINFTYTNQPLE